MNIAHELNLFQPKIVNPSTVSTSPKALEVIYNAISNGFNMTHNDISMVTGFSTIHIGNTASKLYDLGYLSRIYVKNISNNNQYAYTAIKPFKGE